MVRIGAVRLIHRDGAFIFPYHIAFASEQGHSVVAHFKAAANCYMADPRGTGNVVLDHIRYERVSGDA